MPRPRDRQHRPRLLLLTEFFPHGPRAVYGAIQRLRGNIAALQELGTVNVVFLWPEGQLRPSAGTNAYERMARDAWGLDGAVSFIPVATRRKFIDWILDPIWACRGALGFFNHRPSMRTSGRRQARMLRRLLRTLSPDLVFAHRLGAGAALLRARSTPAPSF